VVAAEMHEMNCHIGSANSERPIHLAIIAPGELYGGVERFVNILAKSLDEAHEVKPLVILFNDGNHAEGLRSDGINVIIPEQRWKYDVSLIRRLSEIFRTERIDIVHTNGYKATIVGTLAAKMAGIPVVKTEHGKLEPGAWYDPRHVRMRANLFLDELVTRRLVTHTIYVTHDLQCTIGRKEDLTTSSIIYNGIAPIAPRTSAHPAEIDPHAFNVGIIGRLAEVKGHGVLLRALSRLNDLSDLRVHIIGEGELKAEIQQYCHAQKLDGRVQLLNFRSNIYDYISALDLLVMPSLHEGLPYILLESMYLRVPVIASDTGGLGEILESEVDCLLVESGNEKMLAQAISTLYHDANLRTRLAENAYQKVCKDFMVQNMMEEYLNIFHRFVSARRSEDKECLKSTVGAVGARR
jgi:glycosyltransferase involved in cell wall biosynthesis